MDTEKSVKEMIGELKQTGMSYGQIAESVGVKIAAICRWKKEIVSPTPKHLDALKSLYHQKIHST